MVQAKGGGTSAQPHRLKKFFHILVPPAASRLTRPGREEDGGAEDQEDTLYSAGARRTTHTNSALTYTSATGPPRLACGLGPTVPSNEVRTEHYGELTLFKRETPDKRWAPS